MGACGDGDQGGRSQEDERVTKYMSSMAKGRYPAINDNCKSFYVDCHSGFDPESSLFAPLDSCFRRNDRFGATCYVKKCWMHYNGRMSCVSCDGHISRTFVV